MPFSDYGKKLAWQRDYDAAKRAAKAAAGECLFCQSPSAPPHGRSCERCRARRRRNNKKRALAARGATGAV